MAQAETSAKGRRVYIWIESTSETIKKPTMI